MLKPIGNYIRRTDRLLWLLCLGSSVFACIVLASISMEQMGGFQRDELTGAITGLGDFRQVVVQAGAAFIGIVVAVILSQIDYHHLVQLWPLHAGLAWGAVLPTLFIQNLKLLGGSFVIGYAPDGTDNHSWYKFGPLTFQPAELAKISFILTFAMHLDHVRGRVNEPGVLFRLLLHLMIPCAVIHVQGDDGTMLIFLAIGVCMLFAAGLSWRYILGALTAAVCAVAVAFGFFSDKIGKSYQWLRILAVYDPENVSGWALNKEILQTYTWQQERGEIAIGAGQIFGRGLFSGDYVNIPYAWNDFVFSWIGNAVGFVGCTVVLVVLFGVVVRTLSTGIRSEDRLGSFICTGIAGAILAQILINVGMNLRVLPVIGITLPFYSAGGTSVLMMYICVGLILSVYMHNKKTLFGNE